MTDHAEQAEQLLTAADDWMDADIGWKANLSTQERIDRRTADVAAGQIHMGLAIAQGIADLVAVNEEILARLDVIAAEAAAERAEELVVVDAEADDAEADPVCGCMPHQKYPCGHCKHDDCQDCGHCGCRCRCSQLDAIESAEPEGVPW